MRLDQLEQKATVLKQPGQSGPGTVAITCDDTGRYTRFYIAMNGLLSPPGSTQRWLMGSDIAANRNEACEKIEGDWIWFIDDDHVFARDILLRLLKRDVDIVGPVCLRRVQPFYPTACALNGRHLDLLQEERGLVEVLHTGSSGMLIRKNVLDAIEPPWFELRNGVSEDVTFCQKAREAGFDIHVDLDVPLGHLSTAVIWPTWDATSPDDGRWLVGFEVANSANLVVEPSPVEGD